MQRRNIALGRRAHTPAPPFRASTLNNIVIFVRFADEGSGVFPDSVPVYERMFNSDIPGANSMHNYYREVSYGQFAIMSALFPTAVDSVLSYQDEFVRDYYRPFNAVANPHGYISEGEAASRQQGLVQRAVEAVAPQVPAGIDIDRDGNGFVDNISIIASGEPDAWADLLWPHSGTLWPTVAIINGKQVANFDFELRGDLLRENGGVGTLCHEMFHCLGAPDLYHYSFQGPGEGHHSGGDVGSHGRHTQPAAAHVGIHEVPIRRMDPFDTGNCLDRLVRALAVDVAGQELFQDCIGIFHDSVLRRGVPETKRDV